MIGGYSFELSNVNKIVEGRYAYTVDITLGEHSPAEFLNFRQALERAQPKLLDAQDQPLQYNGGSASYGGDKISMTNQLSSAGFNGAKVGEPVRFLWEIPVETKTLMLPFELKDLPLP